jgi:hypothetical protein
MVVALKTIPALEASAVGEIDALRCQCLCHMVQTMSEFCELMKTTDTAPSTLCESIVTAAVKLFNRIAGFEKFWKQAEEKLRGLTAEWAHCPDDFQKCLNALAMVRPFLMKGWLKLTKSIAKKLAAASADKVLLESKSLMTNEAQQKVLIEAAKQLSANGNHLLQCASEATTALKAYMNAGTVEVPAEMKDLYKTLLASRKHAKVTITIEWAIREVKGFQPKNGAEMAEKARSIVQRMELKGTSAKDFRLRFSHKHDIVENNEH